MASIKPIVKMVCEMSGKKSESKKYNTEEDLKCLAKILAADLGLYDLFLTYVNSKRKKADRK